MFYLNRVVSNSMLSALALTVASTSAGAAAYQIAPSVDALQPEALILSENVLVRQPGRYIGWPDIDITDAGEMLVVFSGDRDWHVDPWGKVQMVRSSDGGVTWSETDTVIDSPLDDRDPSIAVLPNGTLYTTFNASTAFDNYPEYQEYSDSLSVEVREQWRGAKEIHSGDNGASWGSASDAPTATPHGPTVLDDGRLLVIGGGTGNVYQSTNSGLSWSHIGSVPYNPGTYHNAYSFMSETAPVQGSDGRIIALTRYRDGADIELRQTVSEDGGLTWSEPHATGMRGYPAHVLRLSNGWLLASYGLRIPLAGEAMGQRASISKDNGRTWLVDDEIILSNAVPQNAGHLGYPASAQLPDGSIWTVYYQVEQVEHGESPSLMATHWQLRDTGAPGNAVFMDTFEDVTVAPGIPNNPQAGSYPGMAAIDAESSVVSVGGANPLSLGPGSRVLKINGKQRNYAILEDAALPGDVISYEFDFYPGAGSVTFGLVGDQSHNNLDGQKLTVWVQITDSGVEVRDGVDGSSSWVSLPDTAPPPGEWEHYKLSYTVGDSTFDLSVDGVHFAGLGINSSNTPGMIDRLILATGGTNSTIGYIDNALALLERTPLLDGDLDGDGFVGVSDLNIVLVNWNQSVASGDWSDGDASGDGYVGVDDLNVVLSHWNTGTPPSVAIPEPASLSLAGGLLGGLALRRRWFAL